jgi:hypothetical protein
MTSDRTISQAWSSFTYREKLGKRVLQPRFKNPSNPHAEHSKEEVTFGLETVV